MLVGQGVEVIVAVNVGCNVAVGAAVSVTVAEGRFVVVGVGMALGAGVQAVSTNINAKVTHASPLASDIVS